jgi:thiamine monophosphate kinase
LAAAAGEDYCLLCAVDAERFDSVAADFMRAFGRPLYRVGELQDRGGLTYARAGRRVSLGHRGFDHFARA